MEIKAIKVIEFCLKLVEEDFMMKATLFNDKIFDVKSKNHITLFDWSKYTLVTTYTCIALMQYVGDTKIKLSQWRQNLHPPPLTLYQITSLHRISLHRELN